MIWTMKMTVHIGKKIFLVLKGNLKCDFSSTYVQNKIWQFWL